MSTIKPFIFCLFCFFIIPQVGASIVFHKALTTEPRSLDPAQIDEIFSTEVARNLMEGLVIFDKEGQVGPGAAERWTSNSEKTVYIFYLRKEALWSDGSLVKAHDFVASWKRTIDPSTASPYAYFLKPFKNASSILSGKKTADHLGVKALSDYELEVTLEAPLAYFLEALTHTSFFPIHRVSYQKHGKNFTKPGNLVSNSAFILEQWIHHDRIRLKKNPYYHGASQVKIDYIHFYPLENQSTQLERYRAGTLDMTSDLGGKHIEFIKKNKLLSKELVIYPYIGTYYYVMNTKKPPFQDKRIREALSLVVDREKIVEHITKAGETASYNLIPPQTSHYIPQYLSFKDLPMTKRLEKAKKLLQEAGYSSKKPLKIEILYDTNETHKKVAIAVSGMLKEVGVLTTLHNAELKIILDQLRQKEYTSLIRSGWMGDYNDPSTFLTMFLSGGPFNEPGFSSKEYDQLLYQSDLIIDEQERSKILAQAERIFLDSHCIVPLFHRVIKCLVKPYVKGYTPHILSTVEAKYLSIDPLLKKRNAHK